MTTRLNGTGKIIIGALGIIVSLTLGAVGGAYMFGGSAADVRHNSENISETRDMVRTLYQTRNSTIDERVLLHLKPIEKDINEINKKLDRLLEDR